MAELRAQDLDTVNSCLINAILTRYFYRRENKSKKEESILLIRALVLSLKQDHVFEAQKRFLLNQANFCTVSKNQLP